MQLRVHNHARNRSKIFCKPLRPDLVVSNISSAILSFPLLAGFRAAAHSPADCRFYSLAANPASVGQEGMARLQLQG
jgi:hypothetical protein